MQRSRTFIPAAAIVWLAGLFPAAAFAAADARADELAADVVIRRDAWGVPHILAQTEEAGFFAYGYAAAEDHVLTIARLYLAARAEESYYFGEDFVEKDLMTRQLHIYRVAQENFGKLSPGFQRVLNAYAMGFSRYVEQHRSELPEWVKPISGVDVLAHGRNVIIKEFCMNLDQIEELSKPQAVAKSASDVGEFGSNMWAINSTRSASGNALLLGNPHLNWGGSHTWHEAQITVPGRYNFLGATLAGFPGGGIGFNERLGWSHTVNPHDCDDLYAIQLDPNDTGRYLYDGSSLPLENETIEIDVKTDNGMATVSREVSYSHYGPIVARNGSTLYAYKSPHLDEYRSAEQWYLMTKAQSLDEFRNILDMQALPMFNIGYADADGNCFYICNGRFPARPAGYDWSGVVPGGTPATEWYHILPECRLPQLLNPESGYIANSNSSPWYTNLGQIIDRNQYPADLFPLENTLRSQLGLTMLEERGRISFDDILKRKYNEKLLLADRVKRDLVHLASGQSVDGLDLTEAAQVLEAWDNTASPNSVGSVLFVTFWNLYVNMTDTPFETSWEEARPNATPFGIGDDEAALKALAAAMRDLRDQAGSIDVAWGDLFRIRRGDLDIPVGGLTTDFGAFRVIGYVEAADGKMVAAGGDSYVFAVEFSKPVRAKSILAYSESGDPESPHYADQTQLFADHGWKDVWFYENEIAANTERSYHP